MPTEHVRFSYKYEELTDEAKAKAVSNVAEKLGGDWWDSADNDDIGEVIVYTLAEKFKAEGWDTKGVSDFPGIDGIELEGWSLDGGSYVAVKGSVNRDNAPGLTWPAHVDYVELTAGRSYTSINVVPVEALKFTCTQCGQVAHVYTSGQDLTAHLDANGAEDSDTDDDHKAVLLEGLPKLDTASVDAFEQVIRDCLSDALKSGEQEADYKTSEPYAKEWIEGNEPDFNEDGSLF